MIVDEFSSDEDDELPDLIELDLAQLAVPPPPSKLFVVCRLHFQRFSS